jgi:hypothetical protein
MRPDARKFFEFRGSFTSCSRVSDLRSVRRLSQTAVPAIDAPSISKAARFPESTGDLFVVHDGKNIISPDVEGKFASKKWPAEGRSLPAE